MSRVFLSGKLRVIWKREHFVLSHCGLVISQRVVKRHIAGETRVAVRGALTIARERERGTDCLLYDIMVYKTSGKT